MLRVVAPGRCGHEKIVLAVACLLASLGASHAEVVIYKGKTIIRVPPGQPLPSKADIYLLFDFATREFASVLFFKANGERKFSAGPPATRTMTTSPLAGGGTVRLIASASGDETPPDFNASLFYLRGTQKNLVTSTNGVGTTQNEPRVMSGLVASVSGNTDTGSFIELRLNTTYQQPETVRANNAGKTIPQAFDDLKAELIDKGYVSL